MLKVISKNIIGIEAADLSNSLINGFSLTWADNYPDAPTISDESHFTLICLYCYSV